MKMKTGPPHRRPFFSTTMILCSAPLGGEVRTPCEYWHQTPKVLLSEISQSGCVSSKMINRNTRLLLLKMKV